MQLKRSPKVRRARISLKTLVVSTVDGEKFEKLDFSSINIRVKNFARYIRDSSEKIINVLLKYETFAVAKDEMARTLDLLENLHENEKYFLLRIGEVTSFLPKNQPLYALSCFVIVPSLMSSKVHFRIPHSMRDFFPLLLNAIKLEDFFSNVVVSTLERQKFLEERSAVWIDPNTEESWPVTDVVIFTGTPHHAERLRMIFDSRTLFITNGSGHNPVVVSNKADIPKAVDAVLELQLYNQGQDCAAPNSILVHQDVFSRFLQLLRSELSEVVVGSYSDKNSKVGPITDIDELKRIQTLLVDNHEWLDQSTPGFVNTLKGIVNPTIINKPLKEGGNFTEIFAPIIFLQKYNSDAELSDYFEDGRYARNAMYISLFGESEYVDSLVGRSFEGKILHDAASILRNTHLHALGQERGTQPYGGYGYGASNLSINGRILSKPTLPQRDVFEYVMQPLLLSKERLNWVKNFLQKPRKLAKKDIQKLMAVKLESEIPTHEKGPKIFYLDASNLHKEKIRYVRVSSDLLISLRIHPNAEYISKLQPKDVHAVRALKALLLRSPKPNTEEFTKFLYSVSKDEKKSDAENRASQLAFFQVVYQLLFGLNSGPRLASFLGEVENEHIIHLLDV